MITTRRAAQANLARAADALARFGAPANVVGAVRVMSSMDVVWLGQEPARVDLLQTIDGVTTADLFARAVPASVEGVPIRVIGREDLVTNKKASGRPQDLADAARLEQIRG